MFCRIIHIDLLIIISLVLKYLIDSLYEIRRFWNGRRLLLGLRLQFIKFPVAVDVVLTAWLERVRHEGWPDLGVVGGSCALATGLLPDALAKKSDTGALLVLTLADNGKLRATLIIILILVVLG